jgi:hypothetical protein
MLETAGKTAGDRDIDCGLIVYLPQRCTNVRYAGDSHGVR